MLKTFWFAFVCFSVLTVGSLMGLMLTDDSSGMKYFLFWSAVGAMFSFIVWDTLNRDLTK